MTVQSDHDHHSDYEPSQLVFFGVAAFVLWSARGPWSSNNVLRGSAFNCMNVTAVFALKNVYG